MNTSSFKRPALVIVLALAGCATQQQTSSLECGVGAAVVVGGLCKALGGSDQNCTAMAALGGGIGGAACYSYAGRLEKRRQQLAGREQDLDARLAYVRGLNEDGQQLNTELQARVDAASKRFASLTTQTGRLKVSTDQLAKERKQLDDEIKAANQQVALQGNALTEAKAFQAKRTSPDLDSEIAKQERLLADARRHVAAMASMRQSLPAG